MPANDIQWITRGRSPAGPAGSGDIDGLNHTNNAVYVQWCDGSRGPIPNRSAQAWDYRRLDRAMAIRRGEYDYLLPSALGDELTLATWLVASDGKLTMERCFQLVRDRDGVTILRGRWHLVGIELSSGRPRRMPPEFCEVYLAAMVVAQP
jgi:acyl-CoA thioester hydrolase